MRMRRSSGTLWMLLTSVSVAWRQQWLSTSKVNAEKVAVTSKKRSQKLYMWHSDRPGEMTEETFDSLQHQIPG
jgi:hypothetical protein